MKPCAYCGVEMTPTLLCKKGRKQLDTMESKDHIVPRSRAGKGMHNNIVKVCQNCNQDKQHLTMFEYRVLLCIRYRHIHLFAFEWAALRAMFCTLPTIWRIA
jgi:hypothetical protein